MFAYLAVGAISVRVMVPTATTFEVSTDYFRYFSPTAFEVEPTPTLEIPVLAFRDITPPEGNVTSLTAELITESAKARHSRTKIEKVSRYRLSFEEQINLEPVFLKSRFEANLAKLYVGFSAQTVLASSAVNEMEDKISTAQASTEEPEYFDYSQQVESNPSDASSAPADHKDVVLEVASGVEEPKNVDKAVEEVAIDDLISFDYSKASKDVRAENLPKVSAVTTQNAILQGARAPELAPLTMEAVQAPKKNPTMPAASTQNKSNLHVDKSSAFVEKNEEETVEAFDNAVTIQVTGTNLKKAEEVVGFEVRPQDDLSEAISDYNSGATTLEHKLSQSAMTRSITVLKRGFAPTNTDLILEAGNSEATIPVVEENAFNKLLSPYESRGAVGAVLIELDETTKDATLDVPFSKVLRLDESLKVTESDDYSYLLFVGVSAGNALLSYRDGAGAVTSKIIHIHENELTFDANYYETADSEQVELLEEDLLGREKNHLIISEDAVKQFATDKTASKFNDHAYKVNFSKTHLGGRKYLELLHQAEPVYVGFREQRTVSVPSENFMRFILSKFQGGSLGNRCLIQVNLSKKVSKVDVAPESVNESIQAATQILDSDGKFYDSAGPKSEKIIVVGESQGAGQQSQDAKINFKVTYEDGSVQFLGSYCSPNTYLVEQL
jgi:hypothetical protein